MSHTVNFFAGARAATQCSQWTTNATTVGELTHAIIEVFGPNLRPVLAASTLLIDGVSHCNVDPATPLPDNVQVDILPPFAGG